MSEFLSVGGGGFTPSTKTQTTIDPLTSETGVDPLDGNNPGAGTIRGFATNAASFGSEAHLGPAGNVWLRGYTGNDDYNGDEANAQKGWRAEKTLASGVDISLIHDIGFYLCINGVWNSSAVVDRYWQVNLWLGSDGDGSFDNSVMAIYTPVVSASLSQPQFLGGPYIYFVQFTRSDFVQGFDSTGTATGPFDWSDLQDFRIEVLGSNGSVGVAPTGANSSTPVMYVNGLITNTYRDKATIVIGHDDGPAGVYSLAVPELGNYGWKSTQFIYPEAAELGGANMTTAQLVEMYNDGHDMCMHGSYSGDVFGTLTNAELAAELVTGHAWMDTNGMTRAKHIIAYPQGTYNCSDGESFDTLLDAGITVARGSRRDYQAATEWSCSDTDDSGTNKKALLLPLRDLDSTNSLPSSALRPAVERAVKYGGILIVNFHNVVASGASASAINLDDYQEALAILKSYEDRGLIQVKTMSQVFDTDGSLLI